ncbi:hypothetical protein EDC56_2797 [Sinobacterium caligoides]|uniref:Uncharacterized protein n=1 Tax=Sinobacterium caligoides TaxID=933926 RepID=A0A3N2DK28_9GAMM|nr:hypothetical protein [Sinobacterium caligoides]ROS00161.1 hypothetical protein EDC56_2797 [Sinobacterium caligoides]
MATFTTETLSKAIGETQSQQGESWRRQKQLSRATFSWGILTDVLGAASAAFKETYELMEIEKDKTAGHKGTTADDFDKMIKWKYICIGTNVAHDVVGKSASRYLQYYETYPGNGAPNGFYADILKAVVMSGTVEVDGAEVAKHKTIADFEKNQDDPYDTLAGFRTNGFIPRPEKSLNKGGAYSTFKKAAGELYSSFNTLESDDNMKKLFKKLTLLKEILTDLRDKNYEKIPAEKVVELKLAASSIEESLVRMSAKRIGTWPKEEKIGLKNGEVIKVCRSRLENTRKFYNALTYCLAKYRDDETQTEESEMTLTPQNASKIRDINTAYKVYLNAAKLEEKNIIPVDAIQTTDFLTKTYWDISADLKMLKNFEDEMIRDCFDNTQSTKVIDKSLIGNLEDVIKLFFS